VHLPKRRVLAAACLSLAAMMSGTPAAQADGPAAAGTVKFVKRTGPEFDRFTRSPTADFPAWMRSKFWRSEVFTPYFDDKTSWYPNGWVYSDLYAVYKDSSLARTHPEWILKDGGGNKLYIPWGCSNGSCPQFAGDVGDPTYRAWWIAQARASLAHGYKGLWIDDVNLEFRVGNGSGDDVAPIDPRTGGTMTFENWRRYVAEFVEEIRAALPDAEILHNSIWFAGAGQRDRDPYVKRQIAAADYINVERGVNDDGLTGGSGEWSLNALLGYIDRVHAAGKGVILDGFDDSTQGRAYSLASYFMISTGNDGVGLTAMTPENWWGGYDVDLGAPRGGRTTWNGVMRRDFANGMALVNEPGAPTRTVQLGGTFYDADGNPVTSVTLRAKDGAVLRGTPPASAAPAATAETPASTPALAAPGATQTLLETLRTAPVATSAPAGSVAVEGSVKGATTGQVVVRVQRKVRNGFATVRKKTVKVNGKGRFKASVAGLRHGRYRAFATYAGSKQAKTSTSSKRAFKLRKVRRAHH
jgi:hypothetical protein